MNNMADPLEDQVFFISGAGRNLGRYIALAAAARALHC